MCASRVRTVALAALASVAPAVFALPADVEAQAPWTWLSATGYATLGTAIAAVPAFASDSYDGVVYFPIGAVAGGVTGWLVGRSAGRALERGDDLSPLHRNAVRAGTVFAGAGVGMLAAAFAINPDGPSALGSDETVFTIFTIAGGAVGALTQLMLEPRLRPREGGLDGGLGLAPGGRLTARVACRF